MLHELCRERGSRSTRDMVPRQHQPQHEHQLPHHKCMRSLLLVNPASGTKRQRRIQSSPRKQTGDGRVLHDPERQRYQLSLKSKQYQRTLKKKMFFFNNLLMFSLQNKEEQKLRGNLNYTFL